MHMKTLITFIISVFLITHTMAQSPGKYASVNGLKMYYEIHGEGFPLVLIHGGGSTIGTNWGRILPALAKTHMVIAVEMQAHGHTADRDTPETFEQDAHDVAALLQYLNIPKADFMGFSNGGQTSMQIGISHPEIVSKLIIVSAFYKREGAYPWLWQGMEHATLDNMPGPLKKAYLAINNSQTGLQAMFNRDCQRMLHFKDWTEEDIRSIQAPTLVLIGNADVTTPEHALAMSRLLPKGKLVILPGAHGECLGEVMFDEPGNLPWITAGIIEDFLK